MNKLKQETVQTRQSRHCSNVVFSVCLTGRLEHGRAAEDYEVLVEISAVAGMHFLVSAVHSHPSHPGSLSQTIPGLQPVPAIL